VARWVMEFQVTGTDHVVHTEGLTSIASGPCALSKPVPSNQRLFCTTRSLKKFYGFRTRSYSMRSGLRK
jgi:hypothetical protein